MRTNHNFGYLPTSDLSSRTVPQVFNLTFPVHASASSCQGLHPPLVWGSGELAGLPLTRNGETVHCHHLPVSPHGCNTFQYGRHFAYGTASLICLSCSSLSHPYRDDPDVSASLLKCGALMWSALAFLHDGHERSRRYITFQGKQIASLESRLFHRTITFCCQSVFPSVKVIFQSAPHSHSPSHPPSIIFHLVHNGQSRPRCVHLHALRALHRVVHMPHPRHVRRARQAFLHSRQDVLFPC